MLDQLRHCGPDAWGVWCELQVGLGHRMLHTTPESIGEKLPLSDAAASLAITADARIDNRLELIEALGLDRTRQAQLADSEILLAAYQRWGEGCVERLLGDFAFAIWDARQQRLFCARDHFGAKPFFYYRSGRVFAFATEAKGLFGLPDVPRRLNETRVADYLALLFLDKEITFFEGVCRLPPAHTLTVGPAGVQLRRYWAPDSSRDVRRSSDSEYAEEFRAIFTEAVRCRLRSAFPVGAMLSGGLDSSAVACVARDLMLGSDSGPLHTYSALFDGGPESDERSYIEAVARTEGLVPHYYPGEQISPFEDFDAVLGRLGEAYHRPNITLQRSIYRAAEGHGVRVVLDGLGGDCVLSHGIDSLSELLQNRRWPEFGEEVDGLARHFGLDRVKLARQYLTPHLSEIKDRGQWARLVRAYLLIPWHAPYSFRRFYMDYGVLPLARRIRRLLPGPFWRHDTMPLAEPSILDGHFAARVSFEDRRRRLRGLHVKGMETERQAHYRSLTSGRTALTLEEFGRVAAPFRVEARYPHYDRRLAEFCLGLPPEQKLRQGWSRAILRNAMHQILPEEVRWRGGKADLWAPFERGLRKYGQDYLAEAILRTPQGVEQYLDLPVLREWYHQYLSGDSSKVASLWATTTLVWWLQKSGLTPVAAGEPRAIAEAAVAVAAD